MRVKYDPAVTGETTDNTNYSFRISTRVNFVDISSTPTQVFAKPPSIDIQLPSDFMVPFRQSLTHVT